MNTTIHTSMTPLEWSILLALSLLWGGSFFFVGVAVSELPPLTIVLVRVALAAAVLWLIIKVSGLEMPPTGGLWPAFFGMGFLNNLIPSPLSCGVRPISPAAWRRSSTPPLHCSPSSSPIT